MPFIEAGGLTVHYQLTGPADLPVLMLANSIGTNFHIWDAVAAELAGRVRVLCYDMRGHGLSEAVPVEGDTGYSMDDLAGDAVALLDALGIGRAHLCGLSIGGMMAQRFAVRSPERLGRLVLCDTAALIGPPALWTDRVATIRSRGLSALVDGVMGRWFTEGFRTGRPEQIRGYTAMFTRTAPDGYIGCALAIRDADLRADAARIAAPTLVVVGDRDLATTPAQAKELADAIPGARLAVVDGAAHIPCVEQPAVLARLIGDFLAEEA